MYIHIYICTCTYVYIYICMHVKLQVRHFKQSLNNRHTNVYIYDTYTTFQPVLGPSYLKGTIIKYVLSCACTREGPLIGHTVTCFTVINKRNNHWIYDMMCRRQRGASYRSQSDVSHGHARGEQTLLSAQRQQIIVWLLWNTCIRDQKNPAGFLALCRKLPMTRVYIYIHICIHIYICKYICVYIYLFQSSQICIYVFICIYIRMYMHKYIFVYIYICVYIYISDIYIHIYMHAYIYSCI